MLTSGRVRSRYQGRPSSGRRRSRIDDVAESSLIGKLTNLQGLLLQVLAEIDDDGFWPSTWESVAAT